MDKQPEFLCKYNDRKHVNGVIKLSLMTIKNVPLIHTYIYIYIYGPGRSVGIATDYGLDGPRSNPGGDEIFRPYKPALGPTQPPVKWVRGLSRG